MHAQMRYKQRDYSQQVSLTEKAIAKANTKVRVLQNRVGRYTFTMQAAFPSPFLPPAPLSLFPFHGALCFLPPSPLSLHSLHTMCTPPSIHAIAALWTLAQTSSFKLHCKLSITVSIFPPPLSVSWCSSPFLLQANQRKLVEHINSGTAKKIEKLLEQGVDPNFLTEDGSEWDCVGLVSSDSIKYRWHSSPDQIRFILHLTT